MTLGQSLGDTLSGIAQVQAAMEKLRDTAAAVRVPAPAAPAHAAAASPARQAAARTATGALGAVTGVLRGAASAAGSVLKGVLSFARADGNFRIPKQLLQVGLYLFQFNRC